MRVDRQPDCRRCASKAWSRQGRRPRSDLEAGAVAEYLSVLDDAAFGGATPVEPKAISPTDPAARYTAAADKPAVYAYSDNYLIDLKHAVIMRRRGDDGHSPGGSRSGQDDARPHS